jgi:hypothetical protein
MKTLCFFEKKQLTFHLKDFSLVLFFSVEFITFENTEMCLLILLSKKIVLQKKEFLLIFRKSVNEDGRAGEGQTDMILIQFKKKFQVLFSGN